MLLLLPGNAARLAANINIESGQYGWLLTAQRSMTKQGLYGLRFGIDNECFTLGENFDHDRYTRLLQRVKAVHGSESCLFATAPDVVADHKATWERSKVWLSSIRDIGLPVALVFQDGIESSRIQWSMFDAVFIGGSTEWKLSPEAAWCMKEGRKKGKWIHMGRVNSVYRASRLLEFPDSVDGTAWAKHPTKYARLWQAWIDAGKPRQQNLFYIGEY